MCVCVHVHVRVYIYIYGTPQSPHLSCSGGIISKVNSTPVSRVRVHKRRCNREKPRFILLNFLQFLNFPTAFSVLSLNQLSTTIGHEAVFCG